jgi:hypothetical protein
VADGQAALMHQEAARAGELVGLLGNHPDRQLLTGEIGAGKFERFRRFGFVHVDDSRLRLIAPCLEFLKGIL